MDGAAVANAASTSSTPCTATLEQALPRGEDRNWQARARCDVSVARVQTTESRMIDAYLEHWMAYATRDRLRHALALAGPYAGA